MTVFFSADQHIGHKGILTHCKRPYANVEEMGSSILQLHNSLVKPEDTVYMLGDFAWPGYDDLIYQMNGHIHYVHGNHDKGRIKARACYLSSWQEYLEIDIEGQHIVMFHYPIADWNRKFHGAWHLHGHVHGNLSVGPGSWDVGVDTNGFAPVSFEQLKGLVAPFRKPEDK